jgi:hypothetical protein
MLGMSLIKLIKFIGSSKEEIKMKNAIGDAADLIWKIISQRSQPVKLSTLRESIPLSSTFLMAGIGWLAREDKLDIDVDIEKSNDTYSYSVYPKLHNNIPANAPSD